MIGLVWLTIASAPKGLLVTGRLNASIVELMTLLRAWWRDDDALEGCPEKKVEMELRKGMLRIDRGRRGFWSAGSGRGEYGAPMTWNGSRRRWTRNHQDEEEMRR